jgi:2,3-bisphosphoglycerate-independent phosphoglycerate mutase
MKKTVMIMVDGFGIPEGGWYDSVYTRFCKKGFTELIAHNSEPVTSDLGISGIPQSATGQTALFTGKNAAKVMNGHMPGFPGPTLRKLISQENLFSKLLEKGFEVTFANAYVQHTLQQLAKMRLRSVTTVMTEASIGWVKNLHDLLAGNAVYHDLTGKTISGEFNVNKISPLRAAENLAKIAQENDFTLFEYFLTDRAGHKQDMSFLAETLSEFSAFFCFLVELAANEISIILTSDHGNCEDPSTRHHTRNPVPFFLHGLPQPAAGSVVSIQDVYHYVTAL